MTKYFQIRRVRQMQFNQTRQNFATLANFKSVFGNFSMVYLVFAQILNILWDFCTIGQIFIVINGQKSEKSLHHLVTLVRCQIMAVQIQKSFSLCPSQYPSPSPSLKVSQFQPILFCKLATKNYFRRWISQIKSSRFQPVLKDLG